MSATMPDSEVVIRLTASKCTNCDITWYPQRSRCWRCLGENLPEVLLPERGILYSFTVVRVGRVGEPVPYGLAVVDFDGVRIFAKLTGWEEVTIGQEVTVVARSDNPQTLAVQNGVGAQTLTYQFRPVSPKRDSRK